MSTTMPATKLVELRDLGLHLRVEIDARASSVTVPGELTSGGFGQRRFTPTNLRTEDGVEIWTPSSWPLTH